MVDVTDATFSQEVMEASMTTPIVVDLWAEWCTPCKTLGPILEKVIGETNGAVILAKVDVDANPRVAQAFQVQSIPAVFAINEGKIVDSFTGALPDACLYMLGALFVGVTLFLPKGVGGTLQSVISKAWSRRPATKPAAVVQPGVAE